MAIFSYKALSPSGAALQGSVGADSLELAKELLARQGVTITRIEEAKAVKKVRLSSSGVLAFTEDLGLLLKSGLPLYESLVALEEKYRGDKTHYLYLDLAERVKHGTPFSKALESYPKSFSQTYRSLIAAGERSGSLEAVLGRLARLLAKQAHFKRQVTQAMVYPTFLLTLCVGVVSSLFFFLIPTLKDLFEDRALHPLTAFVLKTSDFLLAHTLPALAALLLIPSLFIYLFRAKRLARQREKLFLRLPLIKTLFTESSLYRFSSSLSSLLASEVPLLEALELSSSSMNSIVFASVIDDVKRAASEGKPLSKKLCDSPYIPPLFSRMVRVAEESGSLSHMLGNIATLYESNLDKSLRLFITLLQPALLLLLGIIVGGVLLSVLLPLTDVSSLIN